MYEQKFQCTYLTFACEKLSDNWEKFTQISDEFFIYALAMVMWNFKAKSKKSIDIGGQFPLNEFTITHNKRGLLGV